ncbi:MAG: hypothetical protein V3V40_06495 [Nitrosomonadaceae bacterium]
MVSVALVKGDPIYIKDWSVKESKIAFTAAKNALKYIGVESTDVIQDGNITLTIRRLCKDSERKHVVEKYLTG